MAILFILLFAFLLRLINLSQSLWLDEAVQVITARASFSYIFQEITGDFHPPLYYFLMHFWVRIFGSSEISLRMPSVLFGVGAVYLVYRLGKLGGLGPLRPRPASPRQGGSEARKFGILGAIFMATAPFHIYYSQEARMYSLAAFLTAGSFYFFLRILEDDRGWLKDGRGVGYFIFTLLALYTDYYCFLALLAQAVIVLVNKRFRFFIFYFLYFIFYLPWLPMFITQLKTGMLATRSLPGWGELVNVSFLKAIPLTFIKFAIGRITIFDKRVYVVVAVCLMSGYIWLMIKGVRGWLKEDKGWLRVILCWLLVPITFAWAASVVVPNYQPFRLLLILPAFYLILAEGVQEIKSSVIRNPLIFLILSINLVSLSVYYFNPFFHREDWRGLVRYIESEKEASVILPSETSNWPIRYYDSGNEIKMVYGGTGIGKVGDLGELGNLGGETFYIRYLVPLFDSDEKILAELKARGYTKVNERSFNQIPIWEYQK